MTDQVTPSVSPLARCVDVLLDDYARQGGFLSLDDVSRVSSRKRLTSEGTKTLWSELSARGVEITSLQPEKTASDGDPDKIVSRELTKPASLLASGYGRHPILSHKDEIRLGRRIQAAKQGPDAGTLQPAGQPAILEAAQDARARLILSNLRLGSVLQIS